MPLNQRITSTPTRTTILQHHNRNRPSKWMLTFVLLGLMIAVANAAIDENKPTEKKTVSEPQASPASSLSRITPRDEIYIDDEGLEGSGGRGEIHDDLEKEPDYSGSGFGPDDEDSSPGHHHHNTNTHYSPSSGVSSNSGGSSSNIGSSNTNTGSVNSNSNIGSGINTIGKDSSTTTITSTNRKDLSPSTGSKHDTDEYGFGGVVAGSGDGHGDDDTDDVGNDDIDDFDNDNDHIDKSKNNDPYNHDKSDRTHIDDLGGNNKQNGDNDNENDDHDDDDDEDDDESIYTDVTDPNESDRSGETNINKEINAKTNIDLGIDLDHTSRNNFPTDSNTNIGAGGGILGGNEVLIMNTKNEDRTASFFAQPGILAAVIGGAVVGLLCAILVVMFIVYRMRKKDEGSYALDEPKRSPAANSYAKNVNNREFYA